MGYCPTEAVEAGHSWGVLLYYASYIPSTWMAMKGFSLFLPGVNPAVGGGWLMFGFVFLITPVFIIPPYWVFSLLIRIPFFHYLFTYTTLTHIYRRYHEPETKLKELRVEQERNGIRFG